MKKYSKTIDIPNWHLISKKYASWAEHGWDLHSKQIPKEDYEWLSGILVPPVEKFSGKKHKLVVAIMFFVAPHANRGIHIDSFLPGWEYYPNWGLNIPITNCDKSEQQWFNGEYTQETYHRPGGSYSEKLTWITPPKLVESVNIDSPTLVYVDIPHDVRNDSNLPRTLLSVRFTPNPITITPPKE
jgi:hypothetical protein